MGGNQTGVKMASSPVRRTKFYFMIIAILMTLTLFFLSYVWTVSDKIYKISMIRTRSMHVNFTHHHNESHPNPSVYSNSGVIINGTVYRQNYRDKQISDTRTAIPIYKKTDNIKDHRVDVKHSVDLNITSADGIIKTPDIERKRDIITNSSLESRKTQTNNDRNINTKSTSGSDTLTNNPTSSKANIDINHKNDTVKISNNVNSNRLTAHSKTIVTAESHSKPAEATKTNDDKQSLQTQTKHQNDREQYRKEAYRRYHSYRYRNRLLDRFKHGPLQQSDDLNIPGTGVTVRPEICKDCFKPDFKNIIDAPDICKTGSEIDLLIMIASAPKNSEARNVIRKTWGSVCNDGVSRIHCVYVFGEHKQDDVNTALVEESQLRHDIIQFGFIDTYANLTFKTMMSLRWASDNCPLAKYIMKTDDDMYVNTELLPVLLQEAPDTRFMGGFCWGRSSPHRDRNSKWYVSFEQFAQPFYPQMCSGTGYVMSNDVINGVLKEAVDIPFFYLEDVYISLCLKKLGIHPVLLSGFSNSKVNYEPCSYRNRVITSHGFNPAELESRWTSITNCKKENPTPNMLYIPKIVK